uniref:Uncharacterized protein n=1 Tax=Anguilla anguilla TaxID=7936 RepID=A0A0E9XC00_ANGAN
MGLLPRKPKRVCATKNQLFTHLAFPLAGIHSHNPAQPMAPYLNEHGPRFTPNFRKGWLVSMNEKSILRTWFSLIHVPFQGQSNDERLTSSHTRGHFYVPRVLCSPDLYGT